MASKHSSAAQPPRVQHLTGRQGSDPMQGKHMPQIRSGRGQRDALSLGTRTNRRKRFLAGCRAAQQPEAQGPEPPFSPVKWDPSALRYSAMLNPKRRAAPLRGEAAGGSSKEKSHEAPRASSMRKAQPAGRNFGPELFRPQCSE